MYGHDVIKVMRVHRDAHLGVARPHSGMGLDHSTSVITLGKALSILEAAFFEGGIGMQKPSLVINSTDGLPVPAPRIARRILAVVLLPTATLRATSWSDTRSPLAAIVTTSANDKPLSTGGRDLCPLVVNPHGRSCWK